MFPPVQAHDAPHERARPPRRGLRAAVRLLHLYRPRVPDVRAQAIQVVHTCHALAGRGHEVTLLADRAPGFDGDGRDALAAYGLDAPSTFDLRVAPTRWLPGASLWFRAQVAAWARRPGLVYARAKRYVHLVPDAIPVVIEAHELDSALDVEQGRSPDANRALEDAVYGRATGVVTNCGGTLACIRAARATVPPARVIWNATRADRAVRGAGGNGVGVVGSAREYKGVAQVLAAAGPGVTLVGASEALPGVQTRPAVPYSDVPGLLAGFDALLLPLAPNLFGRELANPLKLWDYLATDRPVVAPDLPTIREVADALCPGALDLYDPADLETVRPAVGRALARGRREPVLRTWDQRAEEIERFLGELRA